MNIHTSILYCLIVVLLLLGGYLVFKMFNLSTSLKSVTRFLDGDVFSGRFHQVLDNYFAHNDNLQLLIHKILPVIYAHTSPDILLAPEEDKILEYSKEEVQTTNSSELLPPIILM